MATNPNFIGAIGVGTDNNLCTRANVQNAPWITITSTGNFLGIKVTAGNFIAVMTDNTVSTAVKLNAQWAPVANSGSVLCVTVVPTNNYGFIVGSWLGVGTDNALYTRPGPGGVWTKVPGPGSVLSIAFAQDGTLLGVGTDNQVYSYTGNSAAANWILIPGSGSVKWICFGGTTGATLYGIGMADDVWYSTDYSAIHWTNIPDTASVVSIDMSGVGGG